MIKLYRKIRFIVLRYKIYNKGLDICILSLALKIEYIIFYHFSNIFHGIRVYLYEL